MSSSVHPLAGLIAGIARIISGVQVRWLEAQPEPSQRIYFANHTSHLDFVVLWASLPPAVRCRTRPVAAQDYWEKGLRRALAVNVFNAVLVARAGHADAADPAHALTAARHTMDHLVESMGSESSLIIFPEGTRGTGEEIAPFKSGLFHLCQHKPGLPLTPVYINNLNRILPKGEILPVPVISNLTFGPSLQLQSDETKHAFLTRARDSLCHLRELELDRPRSPETPHEA